MPRPKVCQHDPLAPMTSLRIESGLFGAMRVHCLVCDKANQVGRKSGRFDPIGAFDAVETSPSTSTGNAP